MKYFVALFAFMLLVSSCDTSKMSETPNSQFLGKWRLSERGILEGIEIEIKKDEKGAFYGLVSKLNDDKYVTMFMEVGDKLVSGIERNSNFEFILKEKKIAAPLFSAYGQSTTEEFVATFDGKNKILLGKSGTDGFYLRITN